MDSLEILQNECIFCLCPVAMFKNVQIYSKTTSQVSAFRTTGPLVDHVFAAGIVTRIQAGIRNRCIGLTCCNLQMHTAPIK